MPEEKCSPEVLVSIPSQLPETTLHHLPCLVNFNGPCNLNSYFLVKTSDSLKTPSGEPVLESAFRGRLLRGQELALPPGYQGLAAESRDGNTRWTGLGSFSKLKYWNLEEVPSQVNPLFNCQKDRMQLWFQWLQLAVVLHSDQTAASATPSEPPTAEVLETPAAKRELEDTNPAKRTKLK